MIVYISTINEYWNWLENSFVWNIHAQQWYNGEPPRNLSGFINDKSNRLIGWATMRQLRVKSTLCHVHNQVITTCQYDYNLLNEDTHSYEPGWENDTIQNYSSSIRQSFKYSTSKDLDTYIYIGDHGSYEGGGYVYEFRGRLSSLQSNLSQLHQLGWIDSQTRAVIIQLTLYNPNVELFTSVTFLTEFLSTSGVYPTSRFEPINFYAFTSIYQLICTILYMLMIIYLIWIEIRLSIELKWKYFYQFWSLIQVGIIICSWTSVGIYIWRYKECQRIGKLFSETNGYVYINLQLTSYVNDILTVLFGLCCFFGTIKFLHLCRFNQRLCLSSETLRYAGKELLSFVMMFSIVFVSFLSLFYLLFVSTLWSCSSLFGTSQMLLQMTVIKFDVHQLTEAAPFLGPFCFSLFILPVVFICMSMFISIIIDSFRRARLNINDNNQQIVSFIITKFQRWTGLKKPTEEEIQEERDLIMRSEDFDPIARFPERIDQLLDAMNRLYMTQR